MRLDKYLKLTRLIKRREVAKVLISENSVLVNNQIVKPSYIVKVNDIIKLTLGKRVINIKVTNIKEPINKKDAENLYILYK